MRAEDCLISECYHVVQALAGDDRRQTVDCCFCIIYLPPPQYNFGLWLHMVLLFLCIPICIVNTGAPISSVRKHQYNIGLPNTFKQPKSEASQQNRLLALPWSHGTSSAHMYILHRQAIFTNSNKLRYLFAWLTVLRDSFSEHKPLVNLALRKHQIWVSPSAHLWCICFSAVGPLRGEAHELSLCRPASVSPDWPDFLNHICWTVVLTDREECPTAVRWLPIIRINPEVLNNFLLTHTHPSCQKGRIQTPNAIRDIHQWWALTGKRTRVWCKVHWTIWSLFVVTKVQRTVIQTKVSSNLYTAGK